MAAAAARWNHRMIVAASPSSAAFTGALGLAVSSVEVVARAENVESRELFFIQRVLHLLETGYGSRAPHRAVCSSQALDSCWSVRGSRLGTVGIRTSKL
ncbi:hypothetical protein YC2023_059541 [Brassica napus]